MRSECDIQTGIVAGSSRSSPLAGSESVITACPYSRREAGATRPPSDCASNCIP